jgi:hypothetical protein
VALAWAVGYPIAFAVLAKQLFGLMGLSVGRLLRDISGILAIVAGAFVVGWSLQFALHGTSPLVRFVVVATAMAALQLGGFAAVMRARNQPKLPKPASL